MRIRGYNPETDLDAVRSIWLECGWIEKGKEECFDTFVETQEAWVAEVEGSVECFASSMEGSVRYLREDLPLALVSAVNTSRAARKQGLAGRLTAHVLAFRGSISSPWAKRQRWSRGVTNLFQHSGHLSTLSAGCGWAFQQPVA